MPNGTRPEPREVWQWIIILESMQGPTQAKYDTIRQTENFLDPNGPPTVMATDYELAAWLAKNWPQ